LTRDTAHHQAFIGIFPSVQGLRSRTEAHRKPRTHELRAAAPAGRTGCAPRTGMPLRQQHRALREPRNGRGGMGRQMGAATAPPYGSTAPQTQGFRVSAVTWFVVGVIVGAAVATLLRLRVAPNSACERDIAISALRQLTTATCARTRNLDTPVLQARAYARAQSVLAADLQRRYPNRRTSRQTPPADAGNSNRNNEETACASSSLSRSARPSPSTARAATARYSS
jgi:hypothetical protein